jgi:hypothetical protein
MPIKIFKIVNKNKNHKINYNLTVSGEFQYTKCAFNAAITSKFESCNL